MSMKASVGYAKSIEGREAGMQAANQALNYMENNPVGLAIIIIPYRYEAQQVINGAASILGNVPMVGFSTTAGLTQHGQHAQGVVVALLGGSDFRAETHWFATYAQSSQETAEKLSQLLSYEQAPAQLVLGLGDGFNGNAGEFCAAIPGSIPLLGGLAGGDAASSTSFQVASTQNGSGSLSAAFIRGDFKVGAGYGHGWLPIGSRFRVTRSRGFWLRTLDGRPANESYAQIFGHTAREWGFPPLNTLARIYPLGLEQGQGTKDLLLRSVLRIEADGSFRLNAPIRDGADVYLMVGSPDACLTAARAAAQQALDALDGHTPVFGLVLVDSAWQTLLQSTPGAELAAINEALGGQVPLAGGYTLGQFVPGLAPGDSPRFMNQNLLVILFGAPE